MLCQEFSDRVDEFNSDVVIPEAYQGKTVLVLTTHGLVQSTYDMIVARCRWYELDCEPLPGYAIKLGHGVVYVKDGSYQATHFELLELKLSRPVYVRARIGEAVLDAVLDTAVARTRV